MCEEARLEKKPIVLLTLRDPSDEAVLTAYSTLSGNQETLNRRYKVFGLFSDILQNREEALIT